MPTLEKNADHLAQFPKIITAERPIPVEIWPDLKGVDKAKVKTWKPDQANWDKFWKTAARFPLVSVDYETSGLRPFHGDRLCGVAASFYDGHEIQGGYWNFRHQGHPAHPFCKNHLYDEAGTPYPKKERKLHAKKNCAVCTKDDCLGYVEEYPKLKLTSLEAMVPVFEKCIISGQNFKFDQRHAHVDGVPQPTRVLDTMLIAHLWDENKKYYNLDILGKEMGEQKGGNDVKEYMDEHNIAVNKTGHAEVACSVEAPYAIQDTVIVLKRLQFERRRWLEANDPKLMEVFQIENAMSTVFAKMEINGMKLDRGFIAGGVKELETEMQEIEVEIYKEAAPQLKILRKKGLLPKEWAEKEGFDILSLDQLWLVLQERGLKVLRMTAKGNKPSLTDFDLGQYKDTLCELVKAFRTRSKMHGTYFKPFLNEHSDPNGYLHSDFFIHGTVSGRASCREPNLQNITRFEKFGTRTRTGSIAQAIREGVGKAEEEVPHLEVRRCFVPRSPEHSMFFFDYAQMELRVFADYADEKFMLESLANGEDIHAATAKQVFPNFPEEKEDPKLYGYFRQLAKQISFGIVYGMGKNKLAIQLDVPVDETVRLVKMCQAASAEGFVMSQATTYNAENLIAILEDHAAMTAARQWPGLGGLGKTVSMKINPEPLEEFLFGDPERKAKHQRLMYSANTFLRNYHAKFPNIKRMTKQIESILGRRGYIFNIYGRRYHLPVEQSYVGVNRLVQGSCADMVKVAQWRIEKLLVGTKSFLINQVHDEMQFDINHSELHLVPKIKEAMEYYPNLKVKMEVEADYSHMSWSDKHEWKGEEEFLTSLKEYREKETKVCKIKKVAKKSNDQRAHKKVLESSK